MMIVCKNPNSFGTHIDIDLIREADEKYNDFTISQLQEVLKTKDFKSLCIDEHVPEVSLKDIEEIAELLKNRTVEI